MISFLKILAAVIILGIILLILFILGISRKIKKQEIKKKIQLLENTIQYYQDIDVDNLFYAQYLNHIFIYNNGVWELIDRKNDNSGYCYIYETISKRSKTDIRNSKDLKNNKIKLLDKKWVDKQIDKLKIK